jgi:Ca2+-binding RTX toxin-like protein
LAWTLTPPEININISHLPDSQLEPTIAIDPNDSNHLFAAANDHATDRLFTAYSPDNGQHWYRNDNQLPASWTDPQATFDQFGNLFLTYIDNSSHPRIMLAQSIDGGQHFTNSFIIDDVGTDLDKPSVATGPSGSVPVPGSVWVSWHDSTGIKVSGASVNGNTVGTFATQALPGSAGGNFGDIKVGPEGQVLVTYEKTTAAEAARALTGVTANTLTVAGTPWTRNQWVNETVRVTDAAGNNPEFRRITGNEANALTVSPAWHIVPSDLTPTTIGQFRIMGSSTIYANLDADGLASMHFGSSHEVTTTQVAPRQELPAQALRGVSAQANLAWDRSGGIYNGRVYLSYTDRALNSVDTQIYVRSSTDSGVTWSNPVRVNDSPSPVEPPTNSHFLPAIAIDQTTGNVGVSWYDARNDPENASVEVFATVSTDGGRTFLSNVQVARGLSNSVTNYNNGNIGEDFGEYMSLVFYGGSLYPIWTDNSTGLTPPNEDRPKFDIATARVRLSSSDLYTWDDLSGAYDSGVAQIVNLAEGLADAAFDVHIPLVQTGFSRALDIGSMLRAPFVPIGSGGPHNDPGDICDFFSSHQFNVEQCGLTPDGRGDLLRLSRVFPFNPQPNFLLGGIGGTLGFSYFDDHVNGSLSGSLQARVQPISLQVTFGVDIVNSVPQLYVADTTNLQIPGVDGQARITGTMNLRNLLNVDIGGDGTLSLGGSLGFRNLHPDHKLHLSDFSPQVVTGAVNGSVRFDNVSLTTRLPILPDLRWTGHFDYDLVTHQFDVGLNAPNPLDVLRGFVTGLFSAKNGFNVLGPLADALNYRLPLVNWSLGEKLGIDGALGWLTQIVSTADLGHTFSEIQGFLNRYNVYIGTREHPVQTLDDFGGLLTHVIQGDRVDLLTFSAQGGNRWETSQSFPLFAGGIGAVTFDIGVQFGGYVRWDYKVGLGIDTTGFYIDPSTHIGIGGGVYGGVNGHVRVLGFPLVEGGGRAGLDASAGLSLRGPNPSSDRIYLDEICNPCRLDHPEEIVQSFLDALQFDATLGPSAHVEAKLNLLVTTITVFSHDWNLGRLVDLHVPLHTTQTKRTMPLNLTSQDLTHDPLVTFNNGVLAIDGRNSTAANLVLLSGRDGTVDLNWIGHGTAHYTNVRQVNFLGGRYDDRLQVTPRFNTPIYAQAGSGNSYFEAGDGPSTIVGGIGKDTLVGGAGACVLDGGGGDAVLIAGTGDNTLIGGGGNALLRGGSGHDLLIGGRSADANDSTTGNVHIEGGSGRSIIWAGGGSDTLVGGTGTSEIHGGRGSNFIAAGALTDYTHEYVEGGGNDVVWAGNGQNIIVGGGGNDTVYGCPQNFMDSNGHIIQSGCTARTTFRGGRGSNLVFGGPSSDLLMAGGGNDRLYSNSDPNHRTTMVAGVGEDWLYGGRPGEDPIYWGHGDDIFQLPFGVVHGTVRSHFFGGAGRDTLAITTDDNDHYIRLTQSSATDFTATSYADPGMIHVQSSFNFDMPSDIHGNFIQNLAMEAISGNNRLEAAPGTGVTRNLQLIGGTGGNDTLVGGAGYNTFWGGTGDDLLIGGLGTNEFHGGTGNSIMIGGPANDVFYSGIGNNDMRGGNGHVIMYGGWGTLRHQYHDTMRVGDNNGLVLMIGAANQVRDGVITRYGNDVTMYGGPGQNVLLGSDGNAEMHAGRGYANLVGGAGAVTMFGGTGYDVLIGGSGNAVMYADDPSMPAQHLSPQDWQARWEQLHEEIHAVYLEEVRVDQLLRDPNLPPAQRQELQGREDELIAEDRSIAQSIVILDDQHCRYDPQHQYCLPSDPNRVYTLANMFIGGSGSNWIYGNTDANFLVGGTGPTTFYAGGGSDTVTGTAGRDTFFIPPVPGNANIVLGAQPDDHGNLVPKVTIDTGRLHLEELVHVRGIDRIGVITGAGNNNIRVDLGSHAVYDIAIQCGNGNDRVDLTGFEGSAKVQAVQTGVGTVLVLGGSARGLELIGGSGSSTYEVDGNGVRLRAEGSSPSMLSVYVNGQPQPRTKITRTTFRRLLIQGQAGTNPIVLGPLGGFSFPELIAHAGPGNKVLDASALAQGVTLLGGAGNDTLIGGSGPNYFQGGPGNDYFEFLDADMAPQRWVSAIIWRHRVASAVFEQRFDPGHGYYLYGDHILGPDTRGDGLTSAHTFTGTYSPLQGPNVSLDFEFDFRVFADDYLPLDVWPVLRQGANYYSVRSVYSRYQPGGWQHLAASLSSADFVRFDGNGTYPGQRPDFSAQGAPISFGLAVMTPSGGGDVMDDIIWGADNFKVVIHGTTSPAAENFGLTSAPSATAGTLFNLTVAARDAAGNLIPGYRGTVTFSSTDRQAGLPANYTFGPGDNGQHTFSVILRTAGAQTVTATDTALGFIAGSGTVTVLPAVASRFDVGAPTSILAGLSFTLTVTAYDPYGNVATGYTGTVHLSSDDAQAVLPPDYQFTTGQGADNGIHTFNVTFKTAGRRTVAVADTITSPRGTAAVTVTPAAATSLQVTGFPSPTTAGVDGTFTVTALDPFGNVDTYYRGIVHFTSADGQAVLDSDYRFLPDDNGVHTFRATLKTAGSQSITAVDTQVDSITGSQTGIAVTPAAADHFQIDAPNHVTANTPFDLTVTALDPYGNIDINYRGTVTFFTTDPDSGVMLPVDYMFTDPDQGVHTFAGEVILVTVGDQVITVADMDNGLSSDATVTVDDAGPSIPRQSGEKDHVHAPVSASPARRSTPALLLPSRAIDHLFAEPTEQEWASWITTHRAGSPR